MKKIDKIIFGFVAVAVSWGFFGQSVCANEASVTLRVCNWEEYIDLGEWDEEEAIELENGKVILGERPLYEDFEDWYKETYGKEVHVEYSCFGTNEDLYNQLNMTSERVRDTCTRACRRRR